MPVNLVGMNEGENLAVAFVEQRTLESERAWQLKEREVIGVEVHGQSFGTFPGDRTDPERREAQREAQSSVANHLTVRR